jgi:signal transduction histidine kinase
MLDLWLIVVMSAWVPNFVVAAIVTTVRFSLGWYSARFYAFVASWTLLIVLLTETTLLYARLASALTLRQRERADRLMSVDAATAAIAHEVRNPLGTIAMNAATALIQLKAEPPELKDMNLLLEEIEDATHRAGGVIASVRDMFVTTTDRRTMVHLENVARQVLGFLRDDLRTNAISVETDFRDGLPRIHADPTQLQQVILSLVSNAIEAMGSTPGTRRLRLATSISETWWCSLFKTPEGELPTGTKTASSTRFSPPSRQAWAWASPSVERSWKITEAFCGLPKRTRMDRFLRSRCRLVSTEHRLGLGMARALIESKNRPHLAYP